MINDITYLLLTPKVKFIVLFSLYLGILLVGILPGLIFYRNHTRAFRLLTQVLAIVFITELAANISKPFLKTNSPFYHFIQILQLGYFSFIFFYLSKLQKAISRSLLLLGLVLSLVSLIISLSNDLFEFPSYGSLLLGFYMSLASLLLFYQILKYPAKIKLYQLPEFWVGCGSLLFYTTTLLVFAHFNSLVQEYSMPEWPYAVIRYTNFLLYGCYAIAINLGNKKSVRSGFR